jgi:hypothetical protein
MTTSRNTASRIAATLADIRPDSIPLPSGAEARLAALTAGDEDPLEVVVAVGTGKGGRGWRYMPEYLQEFVDKVNGEGMVGLLGHQRDEDLGHQFPTPVTHWLAARWDPNAPVVGADGQPTGDKGVAFFRGWVDQSTGIDLKRWIRGKMVTQPSIFGIPTLEQDGGETVVRHGKPLSIDWSPLGRAGMATAQLVSAGEMDIIGGLPFDRTYGGAIEYDAPPAQGGTLETYGGALLYERARVL